MKRIFLFMMAVLSVFCLTTGFTGKAEAARVAVLPIQINEAQVERGSDWNSWYWDIAVDRFHYPDFELLTIRRFPRSCRQRAWLRLTRIR